MSLKCFRRSIVMLGISLTVPLLVPDFSSAFAQTTPSKKKVRKPTRKKLKKPIDTLAPITTGDPAVDAAATDAIDSVAKKKNSFGVMSMVGYQMTFAELELADGTKKSYTSSGLDITGVARYKLALKSVSIPIDLGINYMTTGRVEDDGTTKTEYSTSLMFLEVGSGVEIGLGKLTIPAMLYYDYKLSDSTTVKTPDKSESTSNMLASAYRIKFQTGAIYNLGVVRVGGAAGFHMIGMTSKPVGEVAGKSVSYMGVYFGLVLGAEF